MTALMRPRKIIDLDSVPRDQWVMHADALHLFKGRLWHWEHIGCVMCASANADDYKSQTLSSDNEYLCLSHGELDEVAIEIVRDFTIVIGSATRTGKVVQSDVVLFPRLTGIEDRARVINNLLDEMEIVERVTEDGDIEE